MATKSSKTARALPLAGKGQLFPAPGPCSAGLRGTRPPPAAPHAPPRARSCPLGQQNPSSGARPGLTVTAAAGAATRCLVLARAPPDHAPPNPRPGEERRIDSRGQREGGCGPLRPAHRRGLRPHTDLPSPPRLGRGPRSGSRLTGRRRPRPPPPPATASFHFAAAATSGAHAGPALPSPEAEAGKGAVRAAEDPALVASRRSAAACPHQGCGPSWPGLGREPLREGPEEEPREAPPPAAEGVGLAQAKRRAAAAGGVRRPDRGWRRGGRVREQAEGGLSGPCRLLQSPRAQRHHLGRNTELAAAAQAGRTGWAGRVSRQAARAAAGRWLQSETRGRGDAGRGAGPGRTRGPPRRPPPPSYVPSPPAQGTLGRGGSPRLRRVPRNSVAILEVGQVVVPTLNLLCPRLRQRGG
nr:basic proline-rich protein-like [Dasypus novemcinctus]